MSDPKQASQFDPQKPSGQSPQGGGSPTNDPSASPTAQQQGQQQNGDDSDEDLSQFLQKEHGHTKQSADQEVRRDREGVKRKKKEHEQKHGGSRR